METPVLFQKDNRFLSEATETLLEELTEDISIQRRFLTVGDIEEFDLQWGLDPTGEFVREQRVAYCIFVDEGAKKAISAEIDAVKTIATKKIDALKLASDEHTGLEILHLFILDLLGRDTPAARIFEMKAEEDFKRTKVVTPLTKRVAAVILLTMNIFFAYYSVLYAFKQGVAWQRDYMSACIAQMFVEIFINETLEVIWIDFLVPTLVADEVRAVSNAVLSSVNSLCQAPLTTNSRKGGPESSILNAPAYLFVSTNVAKAYPALMESLIVQTFMTHLPGEISKKWRMGSLRHRSYAAVSGRRGGLGSFLRLNLAFSVAFTALKYMATAPALLHRMFVRSAEPFFVSGIVVAYYIVIDSPIYITIFAVLLALVLSFCVYWYFREAIARQRRLDQLVVHPLQHYPGLEEKSEEILIVDDGSSAEQDDDDNAEGEVQEEGESAGGNDGNDLDSAFDDDAVSSFHSDVDWDGVNSIRVPSNIS